MRIQKRCFLLGLCLLGGVALSLTADTEVRITTTPDTNGENTVNVQPLSAEWRNNDTTEPKSAYPTKEADIKVTTEAKKKPVIDFKIKSDQKYQKPVVKDDDSRRVVVVADNDAPSSSPILSATTPMKPQVSTTTTKPTDFANVTVPFLLRGEPIVSLRKSMPSMSNVTIRDTINSTKVTKETRGRALNISAPEPINSLNANITDLSDVSMDEDDKEVEGGEYVASHNETAAVNISSTLLPKVCVHENRTYSTGERIVRGCEENCVCTENGIANCQPLCALPYVRADEEIQDSKCQKKPILDNPCCAFLSCVTDSDTEPDEMCTFNNRTIARGQKVEDGCSRVCVCEAGGYLKCEPRCPPNETSALVGQHDRCVILSDPRDSCCPITLCDVTLSDFEIKSENSTDLSVNLLDVKVLNSTAIKLKLSAKNPQNVTIEISQSNSHHLWTPQRPDKDGVIANLEPAHTYYVRVVEGSRAGPAIQVVLPAEIVKANISEKAPDKNSCNYKGKSYKIGTEWYDGCVFFCVCAESGVAECRTIECPTDVGLDSLDPNCLDWETIPANPKPPHCCPQEARCRNNGSCEYEGVTYNNWSEIPSNVTGCEKRCVCEMGNVSCQNLCKPVPTSPSNLPCPPHQAILTHSPYNSCCLQWTCQMPPHIGANTTTAYRGPLATDTFDRQTIDSIKRPNNKSETPSQEPERGTFSLSEDPKVYKTQTDSATYDYPHYPMDPGHPTIPYTGPYNPDFVFNHSVTEDVFHLNAHSEKPLSIPNMSKDKSKSKSDAKKPVELLKPHKEITDHYFPGPLALDRFPYKATSMFSDPANETHYVPGVMDSNKIISQKNHSIDRPQFVSLNPHSDMSNLGFSLAPNNEGNISPLGINSQSNSAIGPFHRDSIPLKSDSIDPNVILPAISKKKTTSNVPFAEKSKPPPPMTLDRPKQDQKTGPETSPEQLYLLNLQHPDLINLDHIPSQNPTMYEQIPDQKQSLKNRVQSYFGTSPSASKKTTKPQIFAQKNPNGQTTYHVYTPDIPNTPQQIEELLAHIEQHDSNPGPFQHYPEQSAIPHNVPNEPASTLPLHIDAHIPHSGLTHPFAAQTPNQSGLDHNIIPPGFSLSGFPAPPTSSNEVTIQTLEALNETTVRLVFTVPQVLVGLHGRVELRYTSNMTNIDSSTWKAQVFAPPDDLIATPQLEFELGDLKPMTDYNMKITVKLKDLANSPSSKIYSVRTLEKHEEVTTLPPQIAINAELRIAETNSTWVNVMWKKFTEYELQFIDGVQLWYKERDGKVYATTPLIHRAVTNYIIENLKPSTTYEIVIYFIPFPGQLTELISEKTIQVTTSVEPDPYSFDVKVEIKTVKSTDVEVAWSGVPYPEDKYVNIYRAIYQSDTGKEDTSTFKIAKRDSHTKTVISDLKPGTRYRLWLEIYLTNGRIKKSNVQDFVTKPGILLQDSASHQAGKYASLPLYEADYYNPLVIVAIVASLAILSTLILLLMLMKRRTSSKADISPRKTSSAYDNPSYKTCEDAVTISNGRNKQATDHEMTTISSNIKETARDSI
ncbi:putative epidermal cell surface receptor isoform X2 [Pseudomyrmex gracilis]|uniref:putative epidermal cell surface receptor isoform X2 n=1 Tax=Pseudomyrmex gracilis TaxID=219809 RepID=UPI00099520B1|nr:putative epidermal cell surface receptor isoform X2 [Pseudomyrmex gracilis]